MNVSEYQQLMRRLKSGDRTADQKTRQDLRDAVAIIELLHNAAIDFDDDKCEQQRRDEKRGLYPQHEDVAN